jgi:hypothetical protein
VRARGGPGRPFIGSAGGKREARQAKPRLEVATGGAEPPMRGGDRGAGGRRWQRAGVVARGQGANRGDLSGERRGKRRVARGKQEVAGGGQGRRTVPAAGRQKQSRESRGARKKKGVRTEPGTDLQFQRKAGTSLKRTCNF